MISRDLRSVLRDAARRYPVVTLTGPRQSGKTTLCRAAFPEKRYVSLEPLDTRERARADPRGLLDELREGAVLDEVQHVPELLSYLQTEVDDRPDSGRFVLTGSHHLALSGRVAQTLAGRTAVLHLLPPSLPELRRFDPHPDGLYATLLAGAYPRIHDRGIPSDRWLADYVATYVQRDVRQLLEVKDLATFATFLRVAAGRTAQELHLSSVADDVGVSHNTIRTWFSVLEASYLVFRLPAWHRNPGKRYVKAPKLHWFDSGLVCHLLGIRDTEQLRHHPLRGAIFESWVAAEIAKSHLNRGVSPALHHLRQTRGIEVDLLVEDGRYVAAVEAKSGSTVRPDAFRHLHRFRDSAERVTSFDAIDLVLVHGGESRHRQGDVNVVPWDGIGAHRWRS